MWTGQLGQADGPLQVARAIMASPEAQAHARTTVQRAAAAEQDGVCLTLARAALERLGRRPRIVDIGARMLDTEAHVYDGLRDITTLDVVGFDPMAARIAERLAQEGADGLTLLPYAIGDGERHVLHINNDDSTTSLFPLDLAHNAPLNHLKTLRTVRTETLQTRRLDEVLPDGPVDFLKLDIQGGELMALRHAAGTLTRTAVVHCEVEFSPIYAGQPLFAEVQTLLASQGFVLIDLVNPKRYHYPGQNGPDHQAPGERLVWADAVFFRTTGAPEMLAAQALVAALVYRKVTLAQHLLAEAAGVQHSGQSEPRA
jgi:FkbM family methyltransferase